MLSASAQPAFDLQGHRGCRGLMPENTVPAFTRATELGVTTLEMDVVISKDHQVVVSHEPWMNHLICSHPDGSPVTKKEEKALNLYLMNYEEIQQFDCGKRPYARFPQQKKMPVNKPTLKMVVRAVETFARDHHLNAPGYSIEIKSTPEAYDIFQPQPDLFVRMVVEEIRRLDIEKKTIIQTFDLNVLRELQKVEGRKFRIAFLVEHGKDVNKHWTELGYKPEIYSPHFKLVSSSVVTACHEAGVKIIPWTVNDQTKVSKLKSWNADGIITDYPDQFIF